MLTMLIAYDADGNVVGTLDHCVITDDSGKVIGLVDFEAHENAGGKLTNVWRVGRAVGSSSWPEWIGTAAYDFKVEIDGKKIARLRHKQSGIVRERAAIESRIAKRIREANGGTADIRDIVGGPDRPLNIDEFGNTATKVKPQRPVLPTVGVGNLSGGRINGGMESGGTVSHEGTGIVTREGPPRT